MGTLYVDTGGSATNSGSSDANGAAVSGSAATAASTVITLDGSPSLSFLTGRTSGPTQAAILLQQATNANRKIFWITAFDDSLKTVTVDVAPTGITSSAWAIDGRHVLTNASIEGAVRAGDTVLFNNSPASAAATRWTFRTAGDDTSGFATIKGKAGVLPQLITTNTSVCVTMLANCSLENLELIQQGASGNVINGANQVLVKGVKISDGGAVGINLGTATGCKIENCEVTGVLGDGLATTGNASGFIFGCYIHACGGNGITNAGVSALSILNNIIAANTGRGIYMSGAPTSASAISVIAGNTIYGNGDSGLEIVDTDAAVCLYNNIFSSNGDAAGEYNVEWTAGNNELANSHGWNCFYTAGAGGSGNLSGLTANATEITTDPQMGNPASGDFSLAAASPCKAAGLPGVMIGGPTGYRDMGALQRASSSGGGGVIGS